MAQGRDFLQVQAGNQPLPFFAECAYFLWGEVAYTTKGDCQFPSDRNWTWLSVFRRDTEELIEIKLVSEKDGGRLFEVKGTTLDLVWAVSYLTALRSRGFVFNPSAYRPVDMGELSAQISGMAHRMRAVGDVQSMFLNKALAAFDTLPWWGAWKWCSEFSSESAASLRLTMKVVQDGKASQEMIDWLWAWWNAPPEPDYYEGVRYALYVATGQDPAAA